MLIAVIYDLPILISVDSEIIQYFRQIECIRKGLIEICRNKGQLYHWRQVDSARSFLFTFHRKLFTAEVAKVCSFDVLAHSIFKNF